LIDEINVTDDSEVSWLIDEKEERGGGKRREEEGAQSVKPKVK
jgi:hypothetical protein